MNTPWFMSHDNIVTLTAYMADNGYDAADIAYAVEKPWKYGDVYLEAVKGELDNKQEDMEEE